MIRLIKFFGFLSFYIVDVVKSNFRVAHDVLTPKHQMKPGIISLDFSGMTDRQKVLMANFITMTPGTLGVAVSDDENTLFIHAMYIDHDAKTLADELNADYGRRVKDVF